MKWLDLLNPLNWSTIALQIVGGAILFVALAWYGNRLLEDYYTSDIKAAQALATAKADAAVTARNLENERRKNEALTKQKQKLESNLADARAADAAAVGLRDDLRAIKDRSQTDLAACRNASDTIGQLFVAIDEFAGKVAVEADGHALDKQACYDSWPR